MERLSNDIDGQLATGARALQIGDPLDDATEHGAVVSEDALR